MKKTSIFIAGILVLCFTTGSFAEKIKTVGVGDTIFFDEKQIPSDLIQDFQILKRKCNKCHSHERTVYSVTEGLSPTSKTPFDQKASKKYVTKMIRKPSSDIGSQDAKSIIKVLDYLIAKSENR